MSTETDHSATHPTDASTPEAFPGNGGSEPAIEQLQSDLERFRDLALRSQADFENYRKRSAREKEEAVRFANMSLVERLVPILDNFELGLAAARAAEGAASIVDGMDMVRRQLADVLHQHGVETVEAEGHPFDPNLHEAVAQEASDTVPEGSVVRQLRKGYRLKDRLVRASLVIVSSGPTS
ncbi:MAG: Protein GrpE [Verrucomicrobiota bacterium]|jgi:molecular chaperone GrpE